MTNEQPQPFAVDEEVPPGENRQFRYGVSESYLGDSVGVPENPVALPGHPICHLARLDDETREEAE